MSKQVCKRKNCSSPARRVYCSDKCYRNDKKTDYRRAIKAKAVAYKGGCCQSCGYNRCIEALSFHHTDPSKKEFQVSQSGLGWERIRQEIDKCQLLCCNCHAEAHYTGY